MRAPDQGLRLRRFPEDRQRMLAGDPGLRARVDDGMPVLDGARLMYDARARAGPTQARLEDADCRGHSPRMLRRIAAALGKDVEIRLVPRAG